MTKDLELNGVMTDKLFERALERHNKKNADTKLFEFIGDQPDHWANGKVGLPVLTELDADITQSLSKFLGEYTQYIDEDIIIKAFMGSGIGTNFILFDSNGKAIADLTDYHNW